MRKSDGEEKGEVLRRGIRGARRDVKGREERREKGFLADDDDNEEGRCKQRSPTFHRESDYVRSMASAMDVAF